MDITLSVFGYSSTVGVSRAGNEYQIDSIVVGIPLGSSSSQSRTVVAGGFETYHQRCVPDLVKVIRHQFESGALKPGQELTFRSEQSLYNGSLSTTLIGLVGVK